ncbi:NAD(P)-binding domain superfamily [Arabidopsis suecica]|uniref:NAD(P)-binding domain superfamily n=1 Tax=Arabidopsis suecica TaxID=45249 RepID=A0A8T2BMI7_ARASU|nr:NAD(P)-binding domain superfamily [Arabidopsis suecica]
MSLRKNYLPGFLPWDYESVPLSRHTDVAEFISSVIHFLEENSFHGSFDLLPVVSFDEQSKITSRVKKALKRLGIFPHFVRKIGEPREQQISDIEIRRRIKAWYEGHLANNTRGVLGLMAADGGYIPQLLQIQNEGGFEIPFPYGSPESLLMEFGKIFDNLITHLSSEEHHELQLAWTTVPVPSHPPVAPTAMENLVAVTSVYWDMETCPVPLGCAPRRISPIGAVEDVPYDILREVYPSDPRKTQHLVSLEGVKERLHLFKADLLEQGSFDSAIDGCHGVFHTASPFFHDVKDPQAELIDPAVKGTLNVLNSCTKASSVKRVVVTSSMAAVGYNRKPRTPDVTVDETWFSDPELCESSKMWYVLSKTLAEDAAWKLAKEKGLDIVTINPAMVIGPLLQPTLNTRDTSVSRGLSLEKKIEALESLAGQIYIVDTLGTNVILQRQQRLTEEFVLSADRPLTESEVAFLRYTQQWHKKFVFILNKSDIYRDARELEEAISFVKENTRKLLNTENVILYLVSARSALEAKLSTASLVGRDDLEVSDPGGDTSSPCVTENDGKVIEASGQVSPPTGCVKKLPSRRAGVNKEPVKRGGVKKEAARRCETSVKNKKDDEAKKDDGDNIEMLKIFILEQHLEIVKTLKAEIHNCFAGLTKCACGGLQSPKNHTTLHQKVGKSDVHVINLEAGKTVTDNKKRKRTEVETEEGVCTKKLRAWATTKEGRPETTTNATERWEKTANEASDTEGVHVEGGQATKEGLPETTTDATERWEKTANEATDTVGGQVEGVHVEGGQATEMEGRPETATDASEGWEKSANEATETEGGQEMEFENEWGSGDDSPFAEHNALTILPSGLEDGNEAMITEPVTDEIDTCGEGESKRVPRASIFVKGGECTGDAKLKALITSKRKTPDYHPISRANLEEYEEFKNMLEENEEMGGYQQNVDLVYIPMNWSTTHWVGLVINLMQGTIEVLDPLIDASSDEEDYTRTREEVTVDLLQAKFLEMHAYGLSTDDMGKITDEKVDEFEEDCPVPDGCDPRVIRPSIKRLLEKKGYCGPLTITAIGKLADVPTDTLKALYSSGIHLTIAPFGISDITRLIEIDETANFMVISYPKAYPGLFKTLQAFGYNPLRPFPYHSLDSLIKEDSGILEEETGESASWYCLVCHCDPPARDFNNFITHLSNVDHKLHLSTTRNTVRPPPIDHSRVHVSAYLIERKLMRLKQGPTDLKTAKSDGETLVYWDIKLCPVPHDCDANLVGPRIKRFLRKEGFSGSLTIVAIGVLADVPTYILRALYSSGITFHIVPYGSADIPSLIFECCHRNGPLRNIMVISDDIYLTNQSDVLHSTPFCNFKLLNSLQSFCLADSVTLEEDDCGETGESPFWFCSVCNFRNVPCQSFDSFTKHLFGTYHQRKWLDMWRMKSVHCLDAPLREPLEENRKAVTSVYWDIKRCPVPLGCDPHRVGPCIKRFLENKGYSGLLTITAMGTLDDVPNDILRGVHTSGIALDCIPYGFSISLERHIYEFIDRNPPPANVMVISDAKQSASDAVFVLQSKGYNFVEPVPCDSLESVFLADSEALEGDKCSETSESLLGDLHCWVCYRDFPRQDIDSFTNHFSGTYHQQLLSDRISEQCLDAPLCEPLKENRKAVTSVYWDIKRRPVPLGCDPHCVGLCIKRFLEKKGYSGPLTITTMGALEDVPNDILRGVHTSGIALDCIPYGFSISLERHIYEFIDRNPPPANVMVISDAKHSASDDVLGYSRRDTTLLNRHVILMQMKTAFFWQIQGHLRLAVKRVNTCWGFCIAGYAAVVLITLKISPFILLVSNINVSSKDPPNDVVAMKQKLNLRHGVSQARDAVL